MKFIISLIAAAAMFWFGVDALFNSDFHKRRVAAEQKRVAEEQKPRLFSQDGECAVYTFKGGDRWQYFTKCKNASSSTTTTWEECRMVGKVRQCTPRSITVDANSDR